MIVVLGRLIFGGILFHFFTAIATANAAVTASATITATATATATDFISFYFIQFNLIYFIFYCHFKKGY